MPHSVSQGLLDALLVSEVHDTDQFSSDGGTIRYRLRDGSRPSGLNGPVTTIGDTRLGKLGLSVVMEQLGTEIDFVGDHPQGICIMSVLSGAIGFRNARTGSEEACEAGSLAVFEVEPGNYASSKDGSARINLWVARSRLLLRLEAALDRTLARPLHFAPPDRWPPGTVSSLQRLVAFAASEIEDPYSLLAGGTGFAEFEDLVLRMLLAVPNSYTDVLQDARAPASPLVYRRALEYMRAHLTQALTVADIAAQVGCSPRALANAFRAHSGSAILTLLRNMRLDAARADLVRGGQAGVVDIARRLNFSNVGRFSRQYRARFGEAPRRPTKRTDPI